MKLEIPSYPVISDLLGPVPLVSSVHPLAKINIPQNKGVARRGTDLPTKQSARIKHTCVVICFCVHLLFLSIITFIVALTTPVLYSSENEIKGTNISAHTIH